MSVKLEISGEKTEVQQGAADGGFLTVPAASDQVNMKK